MHHYVFHATKFSCELVADCFLVGFATFGLAAGPQGSWAAFSVSATVFVLVCLFREISGAHLNPATSFSVYMTNPLFSTTEFVYYLCAQVVGCVCGSLLGLAILGEMLHMMPLPPIRSYAAQVFREVVPTWWMIYTIIVLSYGVSPEKATDVIVGLCVAGCILSGSLLGATMNPAVSLGIFISQVMTGDSHWTASAVVIGVLAPLVGTCFAIVTYYITHAYHRPIRVRFVHFK